MNRKSRLATSWAKIVPRIDDLIRTEFGAIEGAELRRLTRTLACWCVSLTHSELSDAELEKLAAWMGEQLRPPYRELAVCLFSRWHRNRSFAQPLAEFAELAKTRVLVSGNPPPTFLDIVNRVHEFLLWLEAPEDRKRRGAYYTPQCIARVVMELAQERAVSMTPDGLGIWSPTANVLDFAAGTGAFFAAGLELLPSHRGPLSHWIGTEVDAETIAIGQFSLTCQQIELGLSLEAFEQPRLICGDSLKALSRPNLEMQVIGTENLLTRRTAGLASSGIPRVPVIVGNPPYSAMGGGDVSWVDGLLRGVDPHEDVTRVSYHRAEKQSARHRKHSLADDYVRFLRIAHWEVEKAGQGVVALILNHNILENRSFGELRNALTEYFDDVLFLDLHGNAKQRELTPEGGRDESVFNIEQGTMIAILAKWAKPRPKQVRIGHVYGLRDEKVAKIVDRKWEQELQNVLPAPPQFYFHCQRRARSRLEQAYAAAPSLAEIFPVHSTAIVTARDGFVVDEDLRRLRSRMVEFADFNISDDVIRAKYFSDAGDTRSWKLERARRALAEDSVENVEFVGFWYRPWDYRWLAYSKHLIDWRREQFSPLLLGGKNLALIARRQSPPGARCNYVWITNSVVLDGILRSDNRGTESVFPLFLSWGVEGEATFNYAPAFLEAAKSRLGFGEADLFYLIVALLHSEVYQSAFREELCRDFPRVLLPGDPHVAMELVRCGREIVAAETMNHYGTESGESAVMIGGDSEVAPGFPKYRNEAIWLNSTTRCEGVPFALWELKAGAHQPIRRWLKQRKARRLNAGDFAYLVRMIRAASALRTSTGATDKVILDVAALEGWLPSLELNLRAV